MIIQHNSNPLFADIAELVDVNRVSMYVIRNEPTFGRPIPCILLRTGYMYRSYDLGIGIIAS